jgi:hypothetical protein
MLVIGKYIRVSGLLLMTIYMINVILLSFVALESEADITKLIFGKDKIKLLGLLLWLAKKKLKPKFGILPIPIPLPFP